MQNAGTQASRLPQPLYFAMNCAQFMRHFLCWEIAILKATAETMSDKSDYIGMLGVAIQIQHECGFSHRETVFVEEKTADGEIVWQGEVETFNLIGHPTARKCYAWQHVDGRGHAKIITVIATPFINSPCRAV